LKEEANSKLNMEKATILGDVEREYLFLL
jgi:hypothetical protein